MLVRVDPSAEYAHCGSSTIEYRSCGGPAWCKPCAAVERAEAWDKPIAHDPKPVETVDPSDIPCLDPRFIKGVCESCDRPLRRHFHEMAQRGIAAFWGEDVSTSRQSEAT